MQNEPQPASAEDLGGGIGSVPSHLSCVQCRSRKLKCDRQQPVCGRCQRQDEPCGYPESRQRAIGRRKTVRELEERSMQPQTFLFPAWDSSGEQRRAPCSSFGSPSLFVIGKRLTPDVVVGRCQLQVPACSTTLALKDFQAVPTLTHSNYWQSSWKNF